MTIAAETIVSIHYTLTNDEGEELDASEEGAPLVYLHGAGNIVPGLETQLEGKAVGDKVDVVVPPGDGYGERHEVEAQAVPRTAFGDADLEPGMSIVAEAEDGQNFPLWVVEVHDDKVMLDPNHPLAGVTLNFAVEVIAVRAATAEELAHGHAHSGDGHHH